MNSLKERIEKGIFWQGLEKVGSYGISFVISTILARLLSPEEFGVIAIMIVFVTISNVFIDSGFGAALIQKKEIDETDCCSIFYANIVISIVLYVLLFFTSPYIAKFYNKTELTLYLRVYMLIILIGSFSVIPSTLLQKRMLFYLTFRIKWVALFISGIVGITMANLKFGVWSLITQHIISSIITVIMYWVLVKWRPQWLFDWKRTMHLLHFGWKVFCTKLLDAIYNDIYSVVIGKFANLEMLSYYDRGKLYPRYGMDIINTTIGNVLFPAFSELQDDLPQIKKLAQRSLKFIMFLVTPALLFIFVYSDSIIIILLTEKWLPCVIFMRLCCIMFLFWPLHTINLQIITACGRSDVFLILEIIKKIQAVVVIAITYRFGVVTMVVAGTAMGLVEMIENAWYNRKLIDYAPWQQLRDIAPIIINTILVATITYFITTPIHNPWLKFFTGAISFGLLYLTILCLTHTMPQDLEQIIKNKVLKL